MLFFQARGEVGGERLGLGALLARLAQFVAECGELLVEPGDAFGLRRKPCAFVRQDVAAVAQQSGLLLGTGESRGEIVALRLRGVQVARQCHELGFALGTPSHVGAARDEDVHERDAKNEPAEQAQAEMEEIDIGHGGILAAQPSQGLRLDATTPMRMS